MAKSSEVHNYDDQYENIYNTSKKDKRYRNKKNRKNNKIDFRTLELEEDDDFKIDKYWEDIGV
jgi:hypothetical protein